MEKIAIVTDSNSGLSKEEAERLGVFLLPMTFTVGEEEHKEGITLTKDMFFQAMREGIAVSTSQPSIAELEDLWDGILKTYDKIIHIPMARELSGSYETAVVFSRDYDGRVLVVDAGRISVTQAATVEYAKQLADQGVSAEEIKKQLEETSLEADIYITVESLEYLKRGGRISGAVALAGELLNIKPVLRVYGGVIDSYAKVRGKKKAKKTMEEALIKRYEELAEKYGAEKVRIYVGHADAEEEMLEWVERWKELFPDKTIETADLPMSISCHVGPGTVGAAVCVN